MSVTLAYDLGGGGLRAALILAEGETAAAASRAFAGAPGGEADPDAWWRAAADLADELSAAAPDPFATVAAIAVAGFTRTQVLVDAAGAPVRPAIGFADDRAAALVPEMLARTPEDAAERRRLNAYHPAARLFWLARHEPEALARAAHVLEPKDFLNLRLTGRVAGDAISAARLKAAAEGGAASVLAALGIDAALTPPLLSPTDVVGPARGGLPGALSRLAGRPVIAMAHDTWAAVLGLGALRPGAAYVLSGTTEVFGLIARETDEAEGLLRVDWGPETIQIGGPSLAGGDAVRWVSGVIAEGGAAVRAGAGDLLFLPYLRGERTPWWDASLRGAFLGLSAEHGPEDLLRAALEGIALLNRVVLDRAEAAAGLAAEEIRFGGGGARNAAWAQIKANACRRPVVATAAAETGLLGCAVAARAALGDFPSLAAAQASMARVARRFEPEPEAALRFDRLLPLFLRAHEALAPISAALARGGS